MEQSLGILVETWLPQTAGFSLEVDIFEKGRKKRRDASSDSFRPGSSEIRIKFGGSLTRLQSAPDIEPNEETAAPSTPEDPVPEVFGTPLEQIADLIKSLEKAEQRPGFGFVALRWFRDQVLPAEGYSWAKTPTAWDEALRAAIQDGAVLTSKVPNPKAPLYPVTAIRLNRQHPQIVAVLGAQVGSSSGFQPVSIRGEELSQTVLRDRR